MNREMRRRMQGAGGLSGGLLQQLQQQLQKAQEELAEETVEVSVGGGAIKLVMDGQQRVRSVSIAPEAVDPEATEVLEDLIRAAVNEAIEKSQELAAKRLGGITGGLGLSGL
jgi:DNA-binding YbaB/EbfC family protein